MSKVNLSRKLCVSSKKPVPIELYKKVSGRSHEETVKIFETELQLGVLTAHKVWYPLPGKFFHRES